MFADKQAGWGNTAMTRRDATPLYAFLTGQTRTPIGCESPCPPPTRFWMNGFSYDPSSKRFRLRHPGLGSILHSVGTVANLSRGKGGIGGLLVGYSGYYS